MTAVHSYSLASRLSRAIDLLKRLSSPQIDLLPAGTVTSAPYSAAVAVADYQIIFFLGFFVAFLSPLASRSLISGYVAYRGNRPSSTAILVQY